MVSQYLCNFACAFFSVHHFLIQLWFCGFAFLSALLWSAFMPTKWSATSQHFFLPPGEKAKVHKGSRSHLDPICPSVDGLLRPHLATALSYKCSYVSTACFCWCLSCELMSKRVTRPRGGSRISEKKGLLINIHESVGGGLGFRPSRQRFFITSCAQHYITS